MKKIAACLVLLLGMPACATAPAAESPPRYAMDISFETGPCFGACPVYRVTVTPRGEGVFEGMRFTAVTGTRRFQVTPAQFEAFARHLEPIRPAGGTVRYAGDACRQMATDLPSVEVTWRRLGDGQQQLYFYYGCDMEENRAIAERLSAAPALLAIGDFIEPRP